MYIAPLKLGSQLFANNLIQGPLAGVSTAPFRELTWHYGAPAYTCTEMISCKTVLADPDLVKQRFLKSSTTEGLVCTQLSSNNPQELGQATAFVTEHGTDLIDLNCGCPVKKIRSKGAGSSLLMDPQKIFQMIQAMKNNTHLPVSIKIRVDGSSNDSFNKELVTMLADSGVDFVIVHGRNWRERYDIPCNYEQISYFVNELPMPVIGNGDIACAESLKAMFATGCAGVMIARSGVGQPWLIKQLQAELTNAEFIKPTVKEVGEMLITHMNKLTQLLKNEKFAILQTRSFAKYYARDIAEKKEFCTQLNQTEVLSEAIHLCEQYFQ